MSQYFDFDVKSKKFRHTEEISHFFAIYFESAEFDLDVFLCHYDFTVAVFV